LRLRLLAIAIGLAVAGMAAVNVVAVLALRTNLLDRIDQELLAVPGAPRRLAPRLIRTEPPPPGNGNNQFFSNNVISRLDPKTGAVIEQVAGPVIRPTDRPDLAVVTEQIKSGQALTDQLVTVPGLGQSDAAYRIRVIPDDSGVVVIARSLQDVSSTIRRVALVDGSLSLLAVAVLVALGLVVIRIGLRPLTDVERAAERIAGGDLSVRAPHAQEPSEVGSLARTFNEMVDQIEDAFEAKQASQDQLSRFVADASHELRTPLTSIRAYAELFRQGVLVSDPQSLQAMGRIEAEATRMGLLVDDLLLLARLDQHPELRADRVDLAPIVTEVVVDAAATAPRHVLEWTAPPDGGFAVIGDEAGLRQVVANLVRNAVIHTPPDSKVTVTGAVDRGVVRLVVADDGPGMSGEAATHVFERFYRPDSGRSRQTAGTGLGLSIVHSLTTAHSGTVSLETSPGRGARFTVTLPAAPSLSSTRSGPTGNLDPECRSS
jgi:two-component system OmpR family sensor kinase